LNTKLKVGQVLWLRVRYQIDVISTIKHPMIVAKIENDYIEVIALDKTADRLYQLFHHYNYYINCSNPKEKVISEDSYAQLNTKLTIQYFPELIKSRYRVETLSKNKLNNLLIAYNDYQNKYDIEEQRIVFMTKEEIVKLNPELIDEKLLV
jgi:hypothetical protein